MILSYRTWVLVLWLTATSVAAAPLEGVDKDQDLEPVPSMGPIEPTPDTLDRLSGPDAGEDAITRRLRVIIDQLRRAGPPPVGCMEG